MEEELFQREVKLKDGRAVYFYVEGLVTFARVDNKTAYHRFISTSNIPVWARKTATRYPVDSQELEDAYQAVLAELITGAPARRWDPWTNSWITIENS